MAGVILGREKLKYLGDESGRGLGDGGKESKMEVGGGRRQRKIVTKGRVLGKRGRKVR